VLEAQTKVSSATMRPTRAALTAVANAAGAAASTATSTVAAAAAASVATATKGPLLRNCLGAVLINKAPNMTSKTAYENFAKEAMASDAETAAYLAACTETKTYRQPSMKKRIVKSAGHIGTLDPFATGALPVFVGLGTKLVSLFSDRAFDKEYTATVKLGVRTASGDLDTDVIATDDKWTTVTADAVREAGSSLVGQVEQKANIFSAQKVGGKPLYWYAHNNKEPPHMPTNTVTVTTCEAQLLEPPFVSMKVQCGSGTYVRNLGEQLAERLGTCGHLTALHRSRRGQFSVDQVLPAGDKSAEVKRYTFGELLDLLDVTVVSCVPQRFERRLDEQLRDATSRMVTRLLGKREPGLYCIQIGEHPVALYQKVESSATPEAAEAAKASEAAREAAPAVPAAAKGDADVAKSLKVIATFPVPPSGFLFETVQQFLRRNRKEQRKKTERV
jgi:tRNA pseudouridine(55) synthase